MFPLSPFGEGGRDGFVTRGLERARERESAWVPVQNNVLVVVVGSSSEGSGGLYFLHDTYSTHRQSCMHACMNGFFAHL